MAACGICGAAYDAAGASSYPKSLVGSGVPGDDDLKDANVGDMYYDVGAGVGYLCCALVSGNKTWTKVVGTSAADIDALLSEKGYATEDYVLSRNFQDEQSVDNAIAREVPDIVQGILDDGGYKDGKALANFETTIEASIEGIVQKTMATYVTVNDADAMYLKKFDAGSTYLKLDAYNADKSAFATTEDVQLRLNAYLTAAIAETMFYRTTAVDAKLATKVGTADADYVGLKTDVSSVKSSVSALETKVDGLTGSGAATQSWVSTQLLQYLKSADAASTYSTASSVDETIRQKTARTVTGSDDQSKFVTASLLRTYVSPSGTSGGGASWSFNTLTPSNTGSVAEGTVKTTVTAANFAFNLLELSSAIDATEKPSWVSTGSSYVWRVVDVVLPASETPRDFHLVLTAEDSQRWYKVRVNGTSFVLHADELSQGMKTPFNSEYAVDIHVVEVRPGGFSVTRSSLRLDSSESPINFFSVSS